MKTYLSKNCWKKLAVIILLLLILIGATKADEQTSCDPCASQTTMSVALPTVSSDLAGSATSVNISRTRLSGKELMEEYPTSIESRIVGIISDMMAVFMVLALLCMFIMVLIK